jgi:hypothetical protein
MGHSRATAAIVLHLGLAAWGFAAWGQEPVAGAAPAVSTPLVLENTGKPILLPFQCTDDDIHAGGLSCTEEEPCPVFLELTVAASAGTRILAAGNLHTDSVTLYSVLLASADGGRTWTEAYERIRAAGLDRIQFQNAEKGWIAGEELSPLPQNPFLLLTSDGGKTWRQRPVLNEAADNRFGTVQQFYFDVNNVGTLIVDRGQGSEGGRYALYESPDGGDNWLIKQESIKPLSVKMPPAALAEWRIRVDAPSKSFRIERRQGERWNPVSAFLVKLDACKPPKPPANGDSPTDPAKPPIKK